MTNLQLHLQKAKRLGVNLTVLATSISLAACGGGGGYYGEVAGGSSSGNDNTNTGGETQSKEVSGVTLALSKNELNVKGDTITLTAKAVDENGGGIAGTAINLNIKDAIKNGATADSSQVITDEKGNATFTVTLSGSNPNLTELLFTATVANTTISDVKKVAVTGAGTVTQSQYELSFEAITPLMVSGGETIVRIRAIDANGGGVPNENIVLKVKEFQKNGVNIKGLSTALTDNQGYADFTLELPTGKEADRAALLNEGIELEAVLTEASGATKTQVYTVGVSSVVNVVSDLALTTTNNNKVDAIDGTINVIVIAKNPEGTVVAGKEVQLSLDEQAIKYGAKLVSSLVKTNSKGEAVFSIKTEANSDNPDGKLLVSNGITVRALLKENTAITTQTTKITVVSPVVDDVASLSMATANEVNIAGGDSVITVTAKDKNGGALANKVINLNIPQTAGLSIKNGSKIITDSNGQAKFTVSFNPSNVPSSVLNDLLNSGIIITAQYKNLNNQTVSQTTKVGFYEVKVEKEVQRIVLTASKGIVSSTGDTVQVTARALDNEGNPAVNKAISLGLTQEAQQNGVSFDGKVTRNTDKDGYVSFTIHTNALNEQAVEKLVQSGIAVAVSTKLADGSIVTQNITVMVAPSALSTAEVAYLGITDQPSLNIAGKIINTIVVQAYKSNGSLAANKDLTLSLDKKYSGISIDNTAPTTNASGQATFNLRYDPSQLSALEKAELLQQGLNITAKFGTVTQKTKVSFYSFDINIQRMDLVVDKPALVAKVGVAQKVVATVTLKDSAAAAIKDRQVTLALDPAALQQGVSIVGATGGSTAVTTAANGHATVELSVNTKDQAMLDALVASGIGIGASAVQGDGSSTISQSTKINVLSEAAENEVGYLTTDSGSVIATTGGSSTITVKAFNSKGIAAAGKTVKLNLGAIPAGLSISTNAVSQTTNANGEAVFTVTYVAAPNLSAEQIKALLAGIQATASYTNNAGKVVSQSTIIQFSANGATITKDAQRIELSTSKGEVVADDDSFTFTAKVLDKDGKPVADKYVSLGLDVAATQNGVTFAGAQQKQTNINGVATFTINVKGVNQQMVDNLIANGINLTASVVQSNGTEFGQTTHVMVQGLEGVKIAALNVEASHASLSVLGGTTIIGVTAVNSAGKPLANREVNFALAPNVGTRVSVDKNKATTNSQGVAYFKVTVSNSDTIDNALVKDGITYAVTAFNDGEQIPKSQVGKINIDAVEAMNLHLSVNKDALLASGDTAEATILLVNKDGSPITDYPVKLEVLNSAAIGVTVNGQSASTTISGSTGRVNFGLKLTQVADQSALLRDGVTVRATATMANGATIKRDIRLNVEQAVSPYHLEMFTNVNDWLNADGDLAVVDIFVRRNTNNAPVSGRDVTLTLTNTNINGLGLVKSGTPQTIENTLKVAANSLGFANFQLQIPNNLTDAEKESLRANGIELEARSVAENGAVTSQIVRINVDSPDINVPQYRLKINAFKPLLSLQDSKTEVTVTLLDQLGNPVSNKYVTLDVINSAMNGAYIIGPTGLYTDNIGRATFKVRVDQSARHQTYSAQQFIQDGLNLVANFSDAQVTGTQNIIRNIYRINVAQSTINEEPQGHLSFGRSALLKSSDDGTYYTESMSAQLVDAGGVPIANKQVTLSVDLLGIMKGQYAQVLDASGSIQAPYRSQNISAVCFGSNLPTKAMIATAFIAPDGSTADIVSYKTDSSGKFDFNIRYLRQYAGWQNTNIKASVMINDNPVQNLNSQLNYTLNPSFDDFRSEAGQPFDTSPYGTGSTCQ